MSDSRTFAHTGGVVLATPVSTLMSAHREIRSQLKMVWDLVELTAVDRERIVRSAGSASLCLRRGLRIHREDEELSVLPRLATAFPGLAERIRQVQEQHTQEDESVFSVVTMCERLSAEPAFIQSIRSELRLAVRHVTVSLETHMSFEERQLFPALVHLPQDMQTSILSEMQHRRQKLGSIPPTGGSL